MQPNRNISELRKLCLSNDEFKQLVDLVEEYINEDLFMEKLHKSYPDATVILSGCLLLISTLVIAFIPTPSRTEFFSFTALCLVCALIITRKRMLLERRKFSIHAKRLHISDCVKNISSDLTTLEQQVMNDGEPLENRITHCFFQTLREIIKLQSEDFKKDCTCSLRKCIPIN